MSAEYSVGQRISAALDHCKPYGVYLSSAGLKILVLISDVSWVPVRDLKQLYKPGEIVDVVLLSYIESEGLWRGSITATHPEDNPLVHLARIPKDTIFAAVVKYKVDDDHVTVQLENKVPGEIPGSTRTRDLRQGDKVNVCVERIDFQKQWVHFRLA
jgi:ribosomal protein S1